MLPSLSLAVAAKLTVPGSGMTAPFTGEVRATEGALLPVTTVTDTALEVLRAPLPSTATAVKLWLPRGADQLKA